MEPSVVLNLATLALKGRNLDEADSRYKQLVELTNDSTAWTGLGLVKMMKFAAGKAIMDEIVFCFSTAKSVDLKNAELIENGYLDACIGFTRELLSNISFAAEYQKKSKLQAIKSALFTGFAYVIRPSEDSGDLSKIISAAAIGFNAANAAIHFANALEAKEVQDRCWNGLSQLLTSIPEIVTKSNPKMDEFKKQFEELFTFTRNYIHDKTGITLPPLFSPQIGDGSKTIIPEINSEETLITGHQKDSETTMPIDVHIQKSFFGKKVYLSILNKLSNIPLSVKITINDSPSNVIETSIPGSCYKDIGQKEGLFLKSNDIILIENEKYPPLKIMAPLNL